MKRKVVALGVAGRVVAGVGFGAALLGLAGCQQPRVYVTNGTGEPMTMTYTDGATGEQKQVDLDRGGQFNASAGNTFIINGVRIEYR